MEKNIFNRLVRIERIRQDKKWGVQEHRPHGWLATLVEEVGELATEITKWDYGTINVGDMEKEIIQIAAVCKAMWECGKRNNWL